MGMSEKRHLRGVRVDKAKEYYVLTSSGGLLFIYQATHFELRVTNQFMEPCLCLM